MGVPISVKKEEKDKQSTVESYRADSAAKEAAGKVMTSDTKAKSVKQGKKSRELNVDLAKKAVKDKRDEILSKPNMDKEGASVSRKEARTNKRVAMRDIRNKERGAIRADRAARQIKTIGDKNNMTVSEATKAYEDRKATLSSYNKNAMKETAEKVASNNAAIQAANDEAKALAEKSTGVVGYNFSNPSSDGAQAVVSGNDGSSPNAMLDAPTQQQASPDRSGPDLTSGRRGPGKFKFNF